MSLLITCDTGGWKTPTRLRSRLEGTPLAVAPSPNHFEQPVDALRRVGPDRAAYLAAKRMADVSGGDLICSEFRADLVDSGRSLHHRGLMSKAVRNLDEETRDAIIEEIYAPYRQAIRRSIQSAIRKHRFVVHLSVRTFDAKKSDGSWRRGDLGLLYDPACDDEVDWSLDMIDELYYMLPDFKVRRNHPHRGTNDSMTKAMRIEFAQDNYLGIELALNRAWAARNLARRSEVFTTLGNAIAATTFDEAQRAA